MYACPPGDERMLRANVQTPFMVVVTFVTASSVNASWRELPVQNAAVIHVVCKRGEMAEAECPHTKLVIEQRLLLRTSVTG